MSTFIHTECACGVDIVAASTNEDDIRLAVAFHNETERHEEWRAIEVLRRPRTHGPCICRGGEPVTNSPHTPQQRKLGTATRVPRRCVRVPRLTPRVKIGDAQ